VLRLTLLLALVLAAAIARADGLTADRLGVIYNRNAPSSVRIAQYYAVHRHVPAENLIGLDVPDRAVINRGELKRLREEMLDKLPSRVQSLLLVWTRPFAVECMSVTTAFAAGYQPGFCEPGCGETTTSEIYNTRGWLPDDTVGWLPAMLLPSQDEALAQAVIDRGIDADASQPAGTVYLVRTQDSKRNVRAEEYADAEALAKGRLAVRELVTPIIRAPHDAIVYFTGIARVAELQKIDFLPGAAADHLTSLGGVLENSIQMPATEWLHQGATGSYGTVSEPCAQLSKFPHAAVFLSHYLRGETLLEAYWKSVKMPGQGLFIGEPLARPFARRTDR
jgi:uncharacterized protein (TIGR03790 family)